MPCVFSSKKWDKCPTYKSHGCRFSAIRENIHRLALYEIATHCNGLAVFNVVEHMMEIGRFDVYEEFETSDAFRFHQNRVQKSEWGVSKNVVRNYTIEGFDESKALEDDEPKR